MNEDDLTSSLCALTTVDNTVDSSHLTVDTGLLSQEVVCDAGIAHRRKLNAFLEECNVMPLNQKRMLPCNTSVSFKLRPQLLRLSSFFPHAEL